MKLAMVATAHCKKAMKLGLSLFFRNFSSSRCKTAAKMAVARIKLLRNKREVVVRQMRRDIAMLLESGQDATARVRVEHVIREQNIMAANEFIELFCELIVARLSIIAKQRECPADLKEGISSLIFAAPRCSDIPELLAIRDIFERKYGKDFVSAATDLRPNSGVNRMLIEKLSVRTPKGETKLKIMKEIAKEYQVEWDTKESEMELLKPPEELIEGPNTFVSASSLPVKSEARQYFEPDHSKSRYSDHDKENVRHFKDAAAAAEAAADSAKKAIAAAEAAAYLANQSNSQVLPTGMVKENFEGAHFLNDGEINTNTQTINRRHSYNNVPNGHSDSTLDELNYKEGNKVEKPSTGYRRHSYNAVRGHSDIKFDESDCDEEIDVEEVAHGSDLPPNRPAPQMPPSAMVKQDLVHRVHPKLPDYDALAARFEALKYSKSLK